MGTSICFMCQNTPLTVNLPDVRPSAFPLETIENGEKNQKSPRLPEQSYRVDLSMRTKRPMTHNLVRSAAPFAFLGSIPGAGPLQVNLPCLYHPLIDLERSLTDEYRYEEADYEASGNLP